MRDFDDQNTVVISGKLPENILYFARVLRGAGLKLGPASVVDAVGAVSVSGISTREDFYWVLHCVFVNRHEDHMVFDEAFKLFWRSRELVEKMLQMFSPIAAPNQQKEEKKAGQTRVSQSLFSNQENNRPPDQNEIEIDALMTASQKEILRKKDFEQMSASELQQARLAMERFVMPVKRVRTRRFEASNHIVRIDPRRTLSSSMRTGGELILPKFKKPKEVFPPIVILADISGSMASYSRMFIHFFHLLSEEHTRVHTFLFGTRLTNVTRQLKKKDPDEAFIETGNVVEDWSGGTRIGTTLNEFNHKWGRRVLGQGAIVLLITDGLERDEDDILEFEMARLHRSCKRLIWLNPLLRFDGFEAKAKGIKTMLKHVDEFRAVHSLEALSDLCLALSASKNPANDPRKWLNVVGN